MKKVFLFFVLVLTALVGYSKGSAYEVYTPSTSFWDNTYVGISGGVATPTVGGAFWKDLNGYGGIRLGKDLNPYFGIALGCNAYFSEFGSQVESSGVIVKYINTYTLAKVNILNSLCGYNGTRRFDLCALIGPGWGHSFVNDGNDITVNLGLNASYRITDRLGISLEPMIVYGMQRTPNYGVSFDVRRSVVQCQLGLSYTFGRVGYTKMTVYDAQYVNTLRGRISDLEGRKPEVVVQETIKEVPVYVKEKVYDPAIVTFECGSSDIPYTQVTIIENASKRIGSDEIIYVRGYADAETGTKELNEKLSYDRAVAVKEALVAYGINENNIVVEGKGVTSIYPSERNRCVVIE